MNLDTLIYDPERLACTDEEKDACLETVKKLARLCPQMRREGMLIVLTLAESEKDPFYRSCLLEFGECPASAEDTLLGALTEDMRKKVEEELPYMSNLREIDVTQAQEELIKQWEAMKPSFM